MPTYPYPPPKGKSNGKGGNLTDKQIKERIEKNIRPKIIEIIKKITEKNPKKKGD